MYKEERKILEILGIEFNLPSTVNDVRVFEERYNVEFHQQIKEFYLDLNGYTNVVEMVDFYSLKSVKKAHESEFNLPMIDSISDYFIIGDFGFQASFWLLEILGRNYKLYVLNLGVVSLVEISLPFKDFFSVLLDDPYSVLGMI